MAGLVTTLASLLIRIRAETVSAPLPLISNEFPLPLFPSSLRLRDLSLTEIRELERYDREQRKSKVVCVQNPLPLLFYREGRENQVVLIPGRSFTFHCHYETKITGDGPFLRRPAVAAATI